MYSASDLRKGLKIEFEGAPYEVTNFEFVKPGKGQAMYKCRLKNLLQGSTMDKTFRAVEKIGKPDIKEIDLVYSYPEGDHFVFIDNKTYDQITISGQVLGDQVNFLVEDIESKVLFYNGQAIQVTLPPYVEKTIAETEPGVRGDTATNVQKPAKLDNGYEVQVPLFINEGDTVRIDTRTGKYFDRVSKG